MEGAVGLGGWRGLRGVGHPCDGEGSELGFLWQVLGWCRDRNWGVSCLLLTESWPLGTTDPLL